jgi:hypothetical protein
LVWSLQKSLTPQIVAVAEDVDKQFVGYDRNPSLSGHRHFSQTIAEGDGISIIVAVDGPETALAAAADGAEAVALHGRALGVRDATELPILWSAPGSLEDAHAAGADAFVLDLDELDEEELRGIHDRASELGIDCVVEVSTEEELERALEWVDPEILLLVAGAKNPENDLELVLRLLSDVPAGKLAIASVSLSSREQVAELERAGVDAVIVRAGAHVAELVGGGRAEL